MKKIHIVLLILIAASIGVLISFIKTTSTFDSISDAKANPGKLVHLTAKLDKAYPVVFDPMNPNYLEFTAKDSTGTVKVVYHNPKPDNFEMSSSLVLKGKFQDGYFDCKGILPKCPSKYKDQQAKGEKHPDSVKIN
jgi:cytochrome c-type biogenesis protein CcmE